MAYRQATHRDQLNEDSIRLDNIIIIVYQLKSNPAQCFSLADIDDVQLMSKLFSDDIEVRLFRTEVFTN